MLTPAIFTPSVRRCLSISIYCGASATREPEDECRPLSVNYRKKTITATHSRAFLLTAAEEVARNRTRQLTATWPKKRSVHGLVAQKGRAGVLATAGARARPNVGDARERAVCSYAGENMHGRTYPRLTYTRVILTRKASEPTRVAIRAGAQRCFTILRGPQVVARGPPVGSDRCLQQCTLCS